MRGVHYIESEDAGKMLQGMIDRKVDYVLFEQLGFGSTYRYLLPCIQSHPNIFKVVHHLPNPDTYLFYFDKKEAMKWLENNHR